MFNCNWYERIWLTSIPTVKYLSIYLPGSETSWYKKRAEVFIVSHWPRDQQRFATFPFFFTLNIAFIIVRRSLVDLRLSVCQFHFQNALTLPTPLSHSPPLSFLPFVIAFQEIYIKGDHLPSFYFSPHTVYFYFWVENDRFLFYFYFFSLSLPKAGRCQQMMTQERERERERDERVLAIQSHAGRVPSFSSCSFFLFFIRILDKFPKHFKLI